MNQKMLIDLKRRLGNRADRLSKLIALNAPSIIIANEFKLVMQTMLMVHPEETKAAMVSSHTYESLLKAGLCPECGNENQQENTILCEKCINCMEEGTKTFDVG